MNDYLIRMPKMEEKLDDIIQIYHFINQHSQLINKKRDNKEQKQKIVSKEKRIFSKTTQDFNRKQNYRLNNDQRKSQQNQGLIQHNVQNAFFRSQQERKDKQGKYFMNNITYPSHLIAHTYTKNTLGIGKVLALQNLLMIPFQQNPVQQQE